MSFMRAWWWKGCQMISTKRLEHTLFVPVNHQGNDVIVKVQEKLWFSEMQDCLDNLFGDCWCDKLSKKVRIPYHFLNIDIKKTCPIENVISHHFYLCCIQSNRLSDADLSLTYLTFYPPKTSAIHATLRTKKVSRDFWNTSTSMSFDFSKLTSQLYPYLAR